MANHEAPASAPSKPSVSLYDLDGDAPDLSIGDKVKAVIVGKVKEIGERESYDKKGKVQHHVCLEQLSVKFMKVHEADDMSMDDYAKMRNNKDNNK